MCWTRGEPKNSPRYIAGVQSSQNMTEGQIFWKWFQVEINDQEFEITEFKFMEFNCIPNSNRLECNLQNFA